MKASLERAGPLVDAEKTANSRRKTRAARLRMAEESLSEARAGNQKMGFAEQKQQHSRSSVASPSSRRWTRPSADASCWTPIRRATRLLRRARRAATPCGPEQELLAAKELDEAADGAEVERLADAAQLEKAPGANRAD